MIILYTDLPGGEWIPFNTPCSPEMIRAILSPDLAVCWLGAVAHVPLPPSIKRKTFHDHANGSHICYHADGFEVFLPAGDVLPVFHSIMLPTGARWDATNRQWTFFICSDEFKVWREKYIANYKPGQRTEGREYWWLDQGPGWSRHGLRAAKKALDDAIATGGPIPDLTRGLFSERQEFGFKPRS